MFFLRSMECLRDPFGSSSCRGSEERPDRVIKIVVRLKVLRITGTERKGSKFKGVFLNKSCRTESIDRDLVNL